MIGVHWQSGGFLVGVAILAASPSAGQGRSAIELRQEAFRSYRGSDAAVSAALGGAWLQQQLWLGLTADAVAAFKALPSAARSRLEEGPFGPVTGEMDGSRFTGEIPDLRLELAAASLLEGDSKGAAALLRRVPRQPDPRSSYPKGTNLRASHNAWLLRGLIERWLNPSPEDPFELLSEAAGWEHRGGPIFRILLGELAEREGYPAISQYSFGAVALFLTHARLALSRR